MLKRVFRSIVFVVIVAMIVGGVGITGFANSQKQFWMALREQPLPSLDGIKKPEHDSKKPTVAVLLGNEITEGLDFTIPYQIFSMTEAYNVYAVAADNEVRSLSGGVDVVPHYSFEELDHLLRGSDDIIVIPYMTGNSSQIAPIRDYILKHKDTTLLSICAGAGILASTGLLNGKIGATHWQTMPTLIKDYPEVNWLEDRRYVTNDNGRMISSAGISSGIDASLYVISQKLGEQVAANIAERLNYPSYQFVANPEVDPYDMDFKYSTYVLNNMFRWVKAKAGVLLYNGIEEMAVASVFDIYSDTGTTRVLPITSTEQPITTKYGLNLIARHTLSHPPQVDKLIVPGAKAQSLATKELQTWDEKRNGIAPQFVHHDANRFIFEVQLEDLAKQEDLLTAKHAVKRLEFRATDIHLIGQPVPYQTYSTMLITVIFSIIIALLVDGKWMARRKPGKAAAA
jgi:AraC family transcriptional activator FtrA